MKKWMFILLGVAFFMPVMALAQHSSKAAEGRPSGSKASKVSTKAVTISGQVGDEGKTLVSDEDDIWVVDNPKILAGHDGQQVVVKCQVQSDKNEIHIFSVKVGLREVKYVSHRGDAAFRR